MTLKTLQDQFQAWLTDDQPQIHAAIEDGPHADKDKLLGIYHHAYRARLIECLGENYPVTWTFLGDAGFESLCLSYIAAKPSGFRSIRWYGHELGTFARETAPYNNHPVLAELIDFEWCLRLVFDAENDDCASMEDMAVLPPEVWGNAYFRPVHSLQTQHYHWNAGPIWRALDGETTPPAPDRFDTAQTWIMWRKGVQSHYRSLDIIEALAVTQMIEGQNFATICDMLGKETGDPEAAAAVAAGYLRQWLEDGLIAKIRT